MKTLDVIKAAMKVGEQLPNSELWAKRGTYIEIGTTIGVAFLGLLNALGFVASADVSGIVTGVVTIAIPLTTFIKILTNPNVGLK